MAVFRACHVYSSYILLHVSETIARSGLVALCVGVFSTNRGRNSLIPWPKRGREMRNGLLQLCHGNIDASENPVNRQWEYAPQGRIYPLVFCVRVCLQKFPDAVSNVVGFALLFQEKNMIEFDRICSFGLKGCGNTSSSSRKMICNCRNITQSTNPKWNQMHPPNLL